MNLKQTLFKAYYTEGETKGNCEQSMLKAGYKRGYARKSAGRYIKATKGMQKAIEEMFKAVQITWEDRVGKVITRLQREIKATESVSALCLLVNAQKGYMDMQAKNEGKYGADNAQRTEEAKLTAVQVEEAKKYAKWRLVQDLTEPESKKFCLKCHAEAGDCSCQKGFYKALKPCSNIHQLLREQAQTA